MWLQNDMILAFVLASNHACSTPETIKTYQRDNARHLTFTALMKDRKRGCTD
jgi:hypothetical protein